MGTFRSTKKSGWKIRQLPGAKRTVFSKISKKEDYLARYTQIFQFFSFPEVLLKFSLLLPECLEFSVVEWFEFWKFNGTIISGNLSAKILYHLSLFQNFWKFNCMETSIVSLSKKYPRGRSTSITLNSSICACANIKNLRRLTCTDGDDDVKFFSLVVLFVRNTISLKQQAVSS